MWREQCVLFAERMAGASPVRRHARIGLRSGRLRLAAGRRRSQTNSGPGVAAGTEHAHRLFAELRAMSLCFVKPSLALIRVKTRTLKNQGCGTRAFAQRRVTSLSFVNPTVALMKSRRMILSVSPSPERRFSIPSWRGLGPVSAIIAVFWTGTQVRVPVLLGGMAGCRTLGF